MTRNNHSFKNGENYIKAESRVIYNELIDLPAYITKNSDNKNLKKQINKYLVGNKWDREYKFSENRRWAMDYLKNRIGIEVELGNNREILFRDFMRFAKLKNDNIIDVGVIITSAQTDNKSNPYPTLGYLTDVLEVFGPVINVPLWIIGI